MRKPVEKDRGARFVPVPVPMHSRRTDTHAPSAELYKATCLSLDHWLSVLAVPDFELYTTNNSCNLKEKDIQSLAPLALCISYHT